MTTSGVKPRYVGFWVRVITLFFDSIILSAVAVAIIVIFFQFNFGLSEGLTLEEKVEATVVGSMVAFQLIPWVLMAAFWAILASSPVKLLLGIRILDAVTLKHPSVFQILLRLVRILHLKRFLGSGLYLDSVR